jgi:hypothetical protein
MIGYRIADRWGVLRSIYETRIDELNAYELMAERLIWLFRSIVPLIGDREVVEFSNLGNHAKIRAYSDHLVECFKLLNILLDKPS